MNEGMIKRWGVPIVFTIQYIPLSHKSQRDIFVEKMYEKLTLEIIAERTRKL